MSFLTIVGAMGSYAYDHHGGTETAFNKECRMLRTDADALWDLAKTFHDSRLVSYKNALLLATLRDDVQALLESVEAIKWTYEGAVDGLKNVSNKLTGLGLEDTNARVTCLRLVVSRVMQHLLCVIMQAQNHREGKHAVMGAQGGGEQPEVPYAMAIFNFFHFFHATLAVPTAAMINPWRDSCRRTSLCARRPAF